MTNKRVMIIDSLNLFIRCYVVDPSIGTNGSPIGGLKGYFKSLQKLIRQIKPDEVVIVWDGPGGSQKKRTIVKDYKEGRKPVRLNRNIQTLNENEEQNNQQWQQYRIFEYINQTPIIQFLEPGIEADDLIALVAQSEKYKDWNKVIVSSDKDFIQLCDQTTILFRPIQDEVKTFKTTIEEYSIHPNNFALARSIDGDKSDNIKGIDGVGLKTVSKYLPFLIEEKSYLISEIETFCQAKVEEKSKTKFYQSIVDNIDLVKRNYSLMQLYSPNLSVQVAQKTRHILSDFKPELNQTTFNTMMIQDGFGDVNFEEMFAMMRRIVRDHGVSA